MNRSGSVAAALKRWLSGCMGQPYMAGLMGFLFLVGMWDALRSEAYPPEIDAAAPDWVFHAYGAYLAVGSVLVLVGVGFRYLRWAVRLERAGHLIVATSMLWLSAILALFAHTLEPGAYERNIAEYLGIAAAFILVQSVARWFWLGRHLYLKAPFPCTHECNGGRDRG